MLACPTCVIESLSIESNPVSAAGVEAMRASEIDVLDSPRRGEASSIG